MHVTCLYLPNFIQFKPPRRGYDVISIFQDGGHGVANLGLLPVFVWHSVEKVKVYLHTKCPWDISIHGRVILLPVSENGWSPYWNCTSGFDFDLPIIIGISFSIGLCQMSSKSYQTRRSYDVISIFHDGGHGVANLHPVVGLVTTLVWEGQNLSAHRISIPLQITKQNVAIIGFYFWFAVWSHIIRHFDLMPFTVPPSFVDMRPFLPKLLAFM